MRINVLIIGSGKMAEAYLKVLKSFQNFNILGAYSRNQKNLKEFCKKNKINNFLNYQHIRNINSKLDLIIIAVTAPNLINVIKESKNLNGVRLLEKPLGISLKDAKFIKKISQKKKYFLALNRRNYESTLLAKKKITSPNIIYIEDHINFDNMKLLGFDKKQFKSFIFSHSIHLVDYLNIFSKGDIKEIKKNKYKLNGKTYLYCFIKFSSGDIGIYSSVYNSKKKWKVTIIDKKKVAEFQPLENLTITSSNNIKHFTPNNHDIIFKPGIFNIIKNINFYFLKKKFKLVNLNEAYNVMNLVHKIHF